MATDSIGTNTLTNSGVTNDASDYVRGDASGIWANDNMSITDALLSDDFPLKNGDLNKEISVACWVKFTSLPSAGNWAAMFAKYDYVTGQRTIMTSVYNSSGAKWGFLLGYNSGNSAETITSSVLTAPVADRWYHVAHTFRDSDKSWKIRVWDSIAETVEEDTGTTTNNINIESSLVQIGKGGASNSLQGRLDEMVVFRDILTSDEIDEIRSGLYGDEKSGVVIDITYDDAATGTLYYRIDDSSDQYADDEVVTNGTNTVTLNATPAEYDYLPKQSRTVSHPEDYAHLEGEYVDVLDDSVVVSGSSIVSGDVSPAITGTTHAGLNYVSTLKPTKLDFEKMGMILTKVITKAIVSFYNTVKGKVGTSSTNMETISFDADLFNGIKEVPINGGYEREGDIQVQQDEPLPMTCRGIILNAGVHYKV